jgi:hypothetical protein
MPLTSDLCSLYAPAQGDSQHLRCTPAGEGTAASSFLNAISAINTNNNRLTESVSLELRSASRPARLQAIAVVSQC